MNGIHAAHTYFTQEPPSLFYCETAGSWRRGAIGANGKVDQSMLNEMLQ